MLLELQVACQSCVKGQWWWGLVAALERTSHWLLVLRRAAMVALSDCAEALQHQRAGQLDVVGHRGGLTRAGRHYGDRRGQRGQRDQ